MASVRRPVQYDEGPQAAEQFRSVLTRVLSVSKEELLKHEAAWKKARKTKKTRTERSA
jgi:hypothetical protein